MRDLTDAEIKKLLEALVQAKENAERTSLVGCCKGGIWL